MQGTTDTRHEVILTSDSSEQSGSHAMVWDPVSCSLTQTFSSKGTLGQRTLQLLSDSYLLAADSIKPYMYVWQLNNPSPLNNIKLTTPGKVSALTSTPNGSYLIAAVRNTLYIWQTCSGRLLATLANYHLQTISCLATTKDGSLFASAGHDGLVFVWSLYNALNDERLFPSHKFADHHMPVGDVHFGHGGTYARLYTVSLDRTVNIYELGSGNRLLSIVFDVPLTVMTVNIRDSQLFVGCVTGDILQCDLHAPPRGLEQHVTTSSNDNAENIVMFRAHKEQITALSVSLDCRTLLSGSTDKEIHIWDIVSRQVLKTIKRTGPVTAAFFAPNFKNFQVPTLRPRLKLNSLQQIADDNSSRDVVEVISRGRDSKEILDFDSFVQGDVGKPQESEKTTDEKLSAMQTEIERLKKINRDMYRYSIANTIGNVNDSRIRGLAKNALV